MSQYPQEPSSQHMQPQVQYPGEQQFYQPSQPVPPQTPYSQPLHPQQPSTPLSQPFYPPQQPMPQPFYPPQQPQPYQQGYAPQQQPYYPQQPYPAPYPPQPYPPQYVVPPVVNNIIVQQKQGPNGCAQALYFVFVGWWLGFWTLQLGFALCALIITLPAGLMILNRLPQIMFLKQSLQQTNVQMTTVAVPGTVINNVNINIQPTQQHPMVLRVLYYLCVGWWAGYFWASVAYGLALTIVGLPLGIVMLNALPAVLTLRKNE